jgi:hypothetical protein
VDRINVLGADHEELLGLWQWAQREYDAAIVLLLTGDRGQGRSVAFHLFRGWHALASMFAREFGLPESELESFALERESKLLASISSRRLSDWASSFESIRDTALRIPWHTGVPGPDERHLRRQARFLGHCLKAQRPRVERVPFKCRSWRVGWRKVLTALVVVVLVVAAFDLGKRLWVSLRRSADSEDTSPTIPEDVYVSLEQLSDPKPRGHAWDGQGTVKFMNRVVVSLDGTAHPGTLIISLDGNDGYRISLMAGDDAVHIEDVRPSLTGGLEIYTVPIPEEAISLGFDAVVIEATSGDGAYALGHLLLGPFYDEDPIAVGGPG